MRIYAIYNIPNRTFVKWGVNGGGKEGYCITRGRPVFFKTLMQAMKAVHTFDNPDDYEVRGFEEIT